MMFMCFISLWSRLPLDRLDVLLSRNNVHRVLSVPESQMISAIRGPSVICLSNLLIDILYSWDVLDADTRNSDFVLRAEEIENVQIKLKFIVKSPQNLEDYDSLKIAILDLVLTNSYDSIAILLGYKDRRFKRIPIRDHMTISSSLFKPTAPEMIFIVTRSMTI